MADNAKSPIKVIARKVILSYPTFDEPKPDDSGKPWFSTTCITTADTNLAELKEAVIRCTMDQFKCGKNEAIQMFKDQMLRSPFRTDVKKKGYPEGATFWSCKSKSAPGIVGLTAGADGKPAPFRGEVYAGVLANVSLRPYWYKQQGGGIAMGLSNVQIIGPSGLRFDSRIAAEDEFDADEEANAAAAGDMSDFL